MIRLIRDHKFYYFLCAITLALACSLLFAGYNTETVVFFNSGHNQAQDVFFALYTNEGDGWIFGLFIAVMLLIRYKYFIAAAVSFLLTTLVVQAGKHLVFPDAKRPFSVLGKLDTFHKVPGVELHINNSFPSGHTATAFAMFTLLVLMTRKRSFHLLFFVLALLVGISRMYLGQHYLSDITAGAFTGIVVSTISYYLFCEKYVGVWGDKSLLKAA